MPNQAKCYYDYQFSFHSKLKREVTYLRGVLETNITEILAVLEEFSEEMTDLHIQQGHTSEELAQTSEELAQTSESVAQLEVLSTGEKHYGKKRATAAIT